MDSMRLCDELLCDEMLHRWTLIRSLVWWLTCCSSAAQFGLTGAVAELLRRGLCCAVLVACRSAAVMASLAAAE